MYRTKIKPSQSDIAGVLSFLEEQERQDERTALEAFYRMQSERRPVLKLNRSVLLLVGLSAVLACVVGAYLLSQRLFPHM